MDDLPGGIARPRSTWRSPVGRDGRRALKSWADRQLADGHEALLDAALPAFERIMIESALARTAVAARTPHAY